MEKNITDKEEKKVIEILTPKLLKHTFELRKPQQASKRKRYIRPLAIAAAIALVVLLSVRLSETNEAKAMSGNTKEIIMQALEKMKEIKSVSMQFDARIAGVTPDDASCDPWSPVSKCSYRLLVLENEILQRIDFDFDSIKVSNIYHNDTVYMWKDGVQLYKALKESPKGIRGLIKMENVLMKFCDIEGLQMEESGEEITISHKFDDGGGSVIQQGVFDKKTELVTSGKVSFLYNGKEYPIAESNKIEYNIPLTKEEMLKIP